MQPFTVSQTSSTKHFIFVDLFKMAYLPANYVSYLRLFGIKTMYLIIIYMKEENVLNCKNQKCLMENVFLHAYHLNHLRYQIIYANSDRKLLAKAVFRNVHFPDGSYEDFKVETKGLSN